MNHAQFWGGAAAPYEIEQSLRFDGSSYLTRTPGSAGNQRTLTFSWWAKGFNPGIDQAWLVVRSAVSPYMFINANAGTSVLDVAHSSFSGNFTAKYRDTSAWYHFVLRFDTENATQSERVILYVNGVRQPNYGDNGNIAQNQDVLINSTTKHTIGADSTYTQSYLKSYMAEVHLVDGTALEATDFGEYDDNGVWRPIEVTGLTYGTNGFYLKFDPSATNGIGHDHSGNGNNWTPTGFTTSGTGTDVMSDTPTTNWATLNPLWNPIEATYAEGNLKFTGGATHSPSVSSISANSGKFYFEATALSGSAAKWSLGIIDTAIGYRKSSGNNYIPGLDPTTVYTDGDALSLYNNNLYKNGSSVVSGVFSGGAVAAGDVVQMAVDLDSGKIWFGIDGTWNNQGGTEGAFSSSNHDATFTAGKSYTFHFTAEDCGWEVNFGQRAFAHTPPTGFNALNTSNLPAPDIADGSKYFNTVLYNGTAAELAVTGVGFQPDFVWLKRRNNTSDHHLFDVVRGVTKGLFTNDTKIEETNAEFLKTFDTNGFTLGTNGGLNGTGSTNVAWNWLAGNGTSSNTNGSITSTVSANPSAGFSIVSYTGNVTAGATVGHGLGVPPDMMIIKHRNSTYNWVVYHSSMDATAPEDYYIALNDYGERAGPNTNIWQSTAPTSTTFKIGDLSQVNADNQPYIAYCFAEVEGYSKFGSYTGNGNADGPFVFCGFKPRWIMLKKSNTSTIYTSWSIYDTARDSYNVSDAPLYANVADQEGTNSQGTVESGHNVDILSNGFKLRDSNQIRNTSGDTYIFAAFAEHPTGGSGVSPATAR